MSDHEPRFPHGFESIGAVNLRRLSYAASLSRGNEESRGVAKCLQGCNRRVKCGSSACPSCMRQERIRLLNTAAQIRNAVPLAFSPFAVTLIPTGRWAASEQLHDVDLRVAKRTFGRAIQRADAENSIWLGGIDISRNEENRRRWWQLHLQAVVWTDDGSALRRQLAHRFRKAPTIPRPIVLKPVFDLEGAITYAFKSLFVRRVTYVDETGRQNARKVGLNSSELRALLVWLDRYHSADRVFLRGARRRGTSVSLL